MFPFLTIHARSLGLTGSELGIIYAILPITGLFGPSLAGLLADKLGNFKIFVSVLLILSGLSGLLYIVVPVGGDEKELPEQLPLDVECSANSSGTVKPKLSCTLNEKLTESFINISKCSVNCSGIDVDYNSLQYSIETWCSSVPDCVIDDFGSSGIERNETQYPFNNFSMPISINQKKKIFNISQPFCPERRLEGDKSSDSGEDNSTAIPNKCQLKCEAFALSKILCTNTVYVERKQGDSTITIIVYAVVRLVNQLFVACAYTLFESAVISIVNEHGGDIGLQRMYANVGQIILTPISGSLIDYATKKSKKPDYRPAFYFFCAIEIASALFFLRVDLNFKVPSESVVKDFKTLIVQPRVFVFLLFIFSNGTNYGFIETFVFWLLEDLGGDTSLMGIMVSVGSAAGIPLLTITSFFIEKLGYVNTLNLCCMIYAVRNIGYSLIQNPWVALPFEAMESFTSSLLNVIAISYAGKLSSPSTASSMQGLLGGTYYGLGKSVGSLIGGIMIERLGNQVSYRILAAIAAITAVLYFLVNRFFFRNPKETPVTVLKEPIEVIEFNPDSFKNNNRITRNNNYNNSKLKGIDNKAFNDNP